MHNIKKNRIVFIVFLTLSSNLFALNKDIFDMKASVEFGLLNGYVKEYVFDKTCKNTDNMMSRLNWDVLFIPYFEGDITFDLFKYLYINANGRIGIPTDSGFMQDYDWLNSVTNGWQQDDPTELTNYSKHTNHLDSYFNWSIKLGGNAINNNTLKLSPFIGYKQVYMDFLCGKGYTIYKWNNYEKRPLNKPKGIRYSQYKKSLLLGVQFDWNISKNFTFNTYIQLIPGVASLHAIDIHYLTSTAYLDYFEKFFELEWKGTFFVNLNKNHKIGISAYVDFIPLIKGISGMGLYTNNKLPDNFTGISSEGGTERLLYSFSLIYQFDL